MIIANYTFDIENIPYYDGDKLRQVKDQIKYRRK